MQPAVQIRYLSSPAAVSMGDAWFDIAKLDHFWVQRRFEILQSMAGGIIGEATRIAEIGCGHGLVQRQIEDAYGKQVTGFDLNERPLLHTVSRTSEICCYDIFQKNPEYKGAFDVIVLFDVLEHLTDQDSFLEAIRFHLAPEGKLLVNVPAFQMFWSTYDEVVGHVRRYDANALSTVAVRNNLNVRSWSYWGMPLIPLLLLRKVFMLTQPREKIISSGMDSRSPLLNRLLMGVSRLEPASQHFAGTSLMAVLDNVD